MPAERIKSLEVDLEPRTSFSLTMDLDGKKRRLTVTEPGDFGYDTPEGSQALLRTVMVAHLVAPFFPEIIKTNFDLDFKTFLDEFYRHYGYKPPRIQKTGERISPTLFGQIVDHENIAYASAHSGGLDSAYRLARYLSTGNPVLAVHLRNLNSKGNAAEARASEKQCRSWHIPYEQVRLVNSSGNTNYDTMRTRDFFLALVVALASKPYGAKVVEIEGDMSTDQKAHFSEYAPAWEMFNRMLSESGLDLRVDGIDPGDVETIGEIIKLEKELEIDILPLVQNCFSAPFQLPNNRHKWERVTPFLANHSPDHWCGSCHKCRRMTLGRIFYGDPRLYRLPHKEVATFVADTYDWMKRYPYNRDLLSDSFLTHLDSLR